jgi:hypothetical protein
MLQQVGKGLREPRPTCLLFSKRAAPITENPLPLDLVSRILSTLFGVVQYFFLMTGISFSYGDSGYVFRCQLWHIR